jgi:hypothetical protein
VNIKKKSLVIGSNYETCPRKNFENKVSKRNSYDERSRSLNCGFKRKELNFW